MKNSGLEIIQLFADNIEIFCKLPRIGTRSVIVFRQKVYIILQLIYSEKVNALAYTKIFDSPVTGDPTFTEIKRHFIKE